MTDVDAGMDDFATETPVPSAMEQVGYMIADAEAEVARHTRNLKASKELLKRLNATLDVMRAGPGA